jgi:hypothetical protein
MPCQRGICVQMREFLCRRTKSEMVLKGIRLKCDVFNSLMGDRIEIVPKSRHSRNLEHHSRTLILCIRGILQFASSSRLAGSSPSECYMKSGFLWGEERQAMTYIRLRLEAPDDSSAKEYRIHDGIVQTRRQEPRSKYAPEGWRRLLRMCVAQEPDWTGTRAQADQYSPTASCLIFAQLPPRSFFRARPLHA